MVEYQRPDGARSVVHLEALVVDRELPICGTDQDTATHWGPLGSTSTQGKKLSTIDQRMLTTCTGHQIRQCVRGRVGEIGAERYREIIRVGFRGRGDKEGREKKG